MKVVLATHNAHKVEELRRILGPELGEIELVGYDGPEPVEDGESFEENALIKARAAAAHTGMPAIADDSGICVDALGGAPGIHSARYSGTRVDADNVARLLLDLGDATDRTAQFVCVAAFVNGDAEFVERGTWPGSVMRERSGANGFGYDPIFRPEGLSISSAELAPSEKDAISHRRRAFSAILPIVRRELSGG
ncbi:MAG: RdgB/HAM1 family non-canonical purine NTP pyrophosphatase [Rhodoglobus sp.]